MPITKSAKKSLRVSRTKQARNAQVKLALEIALKKATLESFSATVSLVDKAVKRQIISANKASRIKSRLAIKLKANQPSPRAKKVSEPTSKKTTANPKSRTKVKVATKKA